MEAKGIDPGLLAKEYPSYENLSIDLLIGCEDLNKNFVEEKIIKINEFVLVPTIFGLVTAGGN